MSNTVVITSREIADIAGCRTDNVARSIERLVNKGKMVMPPFEVKPNDKTGRLVGAYLFSGEQGKKDSLLVIAQVAPDKLAEMAAHWIERAPVAVAKAADRSPTVSKPVIEVAKVAELRSGVTRITSPDLTMTSQEIADLVGSRHDDVKRSIERLAARGVIGYPAMAEKPRSEGRPGKEYIFQGEKGKRDSIIAVAQLSPEFTAVLVDRWQELEAQVAKPAPVNLSDAASLRGLLLGYTEQVMKLEHQVGVQAGKIAEDAPKVKVFTKLVEQKGYVNFQKFCTQLNLHQRKIKAWLRDIGWLRADQWEVNPLPTAKAVDAGYCQIKRFETDTGKLVQQIVFTSKAEAYVELKAPDYVRKPVRKERKSKGKKAA